jgi:hypothetical protein
MRKGMVISPFRDKNHFNVLYEVGAVVEFDDERMQSLFDRQLCEEIKEQGESPAPSKESKKKVKEPEETPVEETKEEKVAEETPVEETKEEAVSSEEVVDEKTKSEQEAAEKIAKVTRKKKNA